MLEAGKKWQCLTGGAETAANEKAVCDATLLLSQQNNSKRAIVSALFVDIVVIQKSLSFKKTVSILEINDRCGKKNAEKVTDAKTKEQLMKGGRWGLQ